MGVPPVIIHVHRIFPDKPSSYRGTPMTSWKPHISHQKNKKPWDGWACQAEASHTKTDSMTAGLAQLSKGSPVDVDDGTGGTPISGNQ